MSQGLGDLVLPSSLALLQEKLFNDFTAVDHDVTVCTRFTAVENTNWQTFVHTFEDWYNTDPYFNFWTVGSLYNTGLEIQTQILAWQQKIEAAGCVLSEPLIVQPTPGLDWGTIKTIVIAAAVIGVAVTVYPVVKEAAAVSKTIRTSKPAPRPARPATT